MPMAEYYRDRAHDCNTQAIGFRLLNPALAEMYRIAAEIWEDMRRREFSSSLAQP
jgi:hypothetical protein